MSANSLTVWGQTAKPDVENCNISLAELGHPNLTNPVLNPNFTSGFTNVPTFFNGTPTYYSAPLGIRNRFYVCRAQMEGRLHLKHVYGSAGCYQEYIIDGTGNIIQGFQFSDSLIASQNIPNPPIDQLSITYSGSFANMPDGDYYLVVLKNGDCPIHTDPCAFPLILAQLTISDLDFDLEPIVDCNDGGINISFPPNFTNILVDVEIIEGSDTSMLQLQAGSNPYQHFLQHPHQNQTIRVIITGQGCHSEEVFQWTAIPVLPDFNLNCELSCAHGLTVTASPNAGNFPMGTQFNWTVTSTSVQNFTTTVPTLYTAADPSLSYQVNMSYSFGDCTQSSNCTTNIPNCCGGLITLNNQTVFTSQIISQLANQGTANQPLKVNIIGTVNIPVSTPLIFKYCKIFMGNMATVVSLSNLTFENTDIDVCGNYLWNGIFMFGNGSTLKVINPGANGQYTTQSYKIKSSYQGIVVGNGNSLYVDNGYFLNNGTALQSNTSVLTVQRSTFEGGNLIVQAPDGSQFSMYGIKLNSPLSATIGVQNPLNSSLRNKFKNFVFNGLEPGAAIKISNVAHAFVYNCDFMNCIRAIFAISEKDGHHLEVANCNIRSQGIKQYPYIGILAQKYGLTAYSNRFESLHSSIFCNKSYNAQYEIHDNVHARITMAAIRLLDCNHAPITIDHEDIHNPQGGILATPNPGVGIIIAQATNDKFSKVMVSNNSIKNVSVGVSIFNYSYPEVVNNTSILLSGYDPGLGLGTYGIGFYNCEYPKAAHNTKIGVSAGATFTDQPVGILADFTTNLQCVENNIQDVWHGIWLSGDPVGIPNYRCNSIKNVVHGLSFNWTNVALAGKKMGDYNDPVNNRFKNISGSHTLAWNADLSHYQYFSTNITQAGWDYFPVGNATNINGFELNPSSYFTIGNMNCIYAGSGKIYKQIANGNMLTSYPKRWDAKVKIMKDMLLDSTLLQNADYQNFYTQYQHTNLMKFAQAEILLAQHDTLGTLAQLHSIVPDSTVETKRQFLLSSQLSDSLNASDSLMYSNIAHTSSLENGQSTWIASLQEMILHPQADWTSLKGIWYEFEAQANKNKVGILALGEDEAISIKLYPNPANDMLSIESPAGELKILDLQGKVLIAQKLQEGFTLVNTNSLLSGIYVVETLVNANTFKQKLIIIK